jgi:hypothetical protein
MYPFVCTLFSGLVGMYRVFPGLYSIDLLNRVYAQSAGGTMHNRLLLEMSNSIRQLNQDIINPAIPELTLDDLVPVMTMVASARRDYLQELMAVANATSGELPSVDQIKSLRNFRLLYEELLSGAQALETAIERGYLDVGTVNGNGE